MGYHPTRAHVVEATVGGVTTSYEYETCGAVADLGLPCTVTPAASLPIEYTYSRGGFVETIHKGDYHVAHRYSPFGDLERIEESVEPGRFRIETLTYDDLGQVRTHTAESVETFTAPAGEPLTTTYQRDLLGRVERVIAADGTETGVAYDHQDRVHRVTTGAYSEAYFYDPNGNLERQEIGDATTTWSYDGLDRLTSVTDPEEGQLSFSYRPNGDPLRTVLTQVDRADFGVLAQVDYVERDAFGRSRGHQLGGRPDAAYHVVHQGREMNISGPGSLSETYTWDSGLRPKLSNRAGVFATDRSYDLEGRLATVSHLAGGRDYGASLSYSPLGDLEVVNDAQGALRTQYAHRLDGAVTAVTAVTEVTDEGALGLTTETGRSVLGEPLSERRANGVTTEVALDGQRRVRSWGLQSGVGRQYVYDQQNRLTAIVYRDGSQMSFDGFDARNRPEDITIPGEPVPMQASYDRLGRPVGLVTVFGGEGTSESVVYDALDRARELTSDAGTIRHKYDSLGVLEQTEFSSEGRTYTLDVVPTPTGVPSAMTYPSRTKLGLGRDAGRRLSAIRDLSSSAAGEVIAGDIMYATPTKPGSMKLGPSGLVREDVYDARQRLEKRIYRTSSEVVAELRYAYDGADREVARQYGHRGHRTDLYVYDDGGRLVRADLATRLIHPDNLPMTPFVHGWDVAPSVAPQISAGTFSFGDVLREYGFDLTGKDHLESALSTTYDGPGVPPLVPSIASTYEGEDGLGFLTEVDGFTRSRDALGNATRIETRTPEVQSPKAPLDLVFDAHSRLRRATRSDGVVVEYGYRADGVLLSRKRTCGSTPPVGCQNTTRLYLYDGMLLLEEVELGSTAAQDQVMARYYYAEEGDIPIAGDFRMGPGPAGLVRLYFVVDRQGSVLGLVDEGGAWVERVRYDVWGAPVFEQADVMPPVVSEVRTDAATGDVVLVMSEPVVPRAVLPAEPMGMATEAVDLSSEVFFEDDLGQEVPGRVTVDLDMVDDAGVSVGSVLRWTPTVALAVGAMLTLRVAEGAMVDDHGLRNAQVVQAVSYGTGVAYSGPAPGSTQAGLQGQSLVGNRLLFQSHFWDADVGLYHMRARMFDPRSGTFLSRDPSGYVDSVNLYAPMRWDVVNLRDPTGRQSVETDEDRCRQEAFAKGMTFPDAQAKCVGGGQVEEPAFWERWVAGYRNWRRERERRAAEAILQEAEELAKQTTRRSGGEQIGSIPGLTTQQRREIRAGGETLAKGAGDVVEDLTIAKGAGSTLAGFGGLRKVGKLIPWSSSRVASAAGAIQRGASEVAVRGRDEAGEVFLGLYQGRGLRNTTGMTGRQVREQFGGKAGTYHWDVEDVMHGGRPHLQIHDEAGNVIRIFY